MKNGDKYRGVFSGVINSSTTLQQPQYHLKMVKRLTSNPTKDFIGQGKEHTMTFPISDTVDLSATNVSLVNRKNKSGSGKSIYTHISIHHV